jgi:hypothetical protein
MMDKSGNTVDIIQKELDETVDFLMKYYMGEWHDDENS